MKKSLERVDLGGTAGLPNSVESLGAMATLAWPCLSFGTCSRKCEHGTHLHKREYCARLLALAFTILLSWGWQAARGSEPAVSEATIELEDNRYLVEANRSNGAIARILDKQGGCELICDPRLADNFRFTLPIPGKEPWQTLEANYIKGKEQRLASCEATTTKLTLHWSKPLINYLGEPFDASAMMTVEFTSDGVLFNLKIDNSSAYEIGEVFFPLIGGIRGLGHSEEQLKATEFVRPKSADAVSSMDIFRVFTNMSPFGDQGPEQFYGCPKDMPEPWAGFFAPRLNRSVCFGLHDANDRPKALWLELTPGNSATPREDGNWPRPGELRGRPVGVCMCFVEFANTPAGTTYEAAPVLIAVHDGDWHESRKRHQHWKASK